MAQWPISCFFYLFLWSTLGWDSSYSYNWDIPRYYQDFNFVREGTQARLVKTKNDTLIQAKDLMEPNPWLSAETDKTVFKKYKKVQYEVLSKVSFCREPLHLFWQGLFAQAFLDVLEN